MCVIEQEIFSFLCRKSGCAPVFDAVIAICRFVRAECLLGDSTLIKCLQVGQQKKERPFLDAKLLTEKLKTHRPFIPEIGLLFGDSDESLEAKLLNEIYACARTKRSVSIGDYLDPYHFIHFPKLLERLIGDSLVESDKQYYIKRNIRVTNNALMTASFVRDFNLGCGALDSFCYSHSSSENERVFLVKDQFLGVMSEAGIPEYVRNAIFDCCVLVRYLKFCIEDNALTAAFRSDNVDPQYLLTTLFGIPTDIPGFDYLFGAGLMLPAVSDAQVPGRSVLVKGDAGSGKTLLTLKIAENIAQKGGTAWFLSVEQTPDECLYLLEILGSREGLKNYDIATTRDEVERLLNDDSRNRGTFILLALDGNVGVEPTLAYAQKCINTYNTNLGDICIFCLDGVSSISVNKQSILRSEMEFVSQANQSIEDGKIARRQKGGKSLKRQVPSLLEDIERQIRNQNLRSVAEIEREAVGENSLRNQISVLLDQIKGNGVNVIFTAESDEIQNANFYYLKYIVDTVLDLIVDSQHGYARRLFQISKSRFQREHRGQHPYSIQPRVGITIYPSPASVRRRNKGRALASSNYTLSTGVASLDRLFEHAPQRAECDNEFHERPSSAIRQGDVVAVLGQIGSWKSRLGLEFINHVDQERANCLSICLSPRLNKTRIRRKFEFPVKGNETAPKRRIISDIDQIPFMEERFPSEKKPCGLIYAYEFPANFAAPGYIFSDLLEICNAATKNNFAVDRVFLENLVSWEDAYPFLAEDVSFVDTLIDFFRRRSIATFISMPLDSERKRSTTFETIVDNADSVLELRTIGGAGSDRVQVQLVQTPEMEHRKGIFELRADRENGGLQVLRNPTLYVRSEKGELEKAPIRVFFHAETKQQQLYHTRILSKLSEEFASGIEVSSADFLGEESSFKKTALRIAQVDEFEKQLVNLDSNVKPRFESFPLVECEARFEDKYIDQLEQGD